MFKNLGHLVPCIYLLSFQDPCLISNVTGYEPYENLTDIEGAIKWPDYYNVPVEDKDKTNALLGYVSYFRFQGPVVQSIVSLTSSLVVKMLIVLISTQVFLLKKCE